MTYKQLLDRLEVDIATAAASSGGRQEVDVIYPMRELTQAEVITRLGEPVHAEAIAGGRVILTFAIDGGRALVVGQDRDGVIVRGMVYLDA